jgi:uncharacterized protein with PIN domain
MKNEVKIEKKQKCNNCKNRFSETNMKHGPDPFLYEVYGEKRKIWLCEKCHKESYSDISK